MLSPMKVLLGMSGGIDSSVAAYLLKQSGYDVEGATMIIWRPDSPYPAPVSSTSCYCPDKSGDLERIDRICAGLGISHTTIDCSSVFEREVLSDFRSEYISGHTPNPCIWCNSRVKFGAMLEYAREQLPFDLFATGHYARITYDEESGRYVLRRAKDRAKDQSYFLSRLSQQQLSQTIFPLGDYTKAEIRALDERLGFHEKGSPESQDFYGGDYSDLLMLPDKHGDIIFPDGTVLGHHRGYWHYTIGQRKGLGVAYHEPLYVTRIIPEENKVVVATAEGSVSSSLSAYDVVYGASDHFDDREYTVCIRSMDKGTPAHVEATTEGFTVHFSRPVRGIAPGQSAVVYDGDAVIASGFIS